MPVYALNEQLLFPPVEEAEDGLLAVGGDLSAERLLLAYQSGIFPWFSEDDPILWWSPDPRFVLYPEQLKVAKSMRSLFNKNTYQITYNTAFESVIDQCKQTARPGQESTWITDDMKLAYIELHKRGIAKSVEVWMDGILVGGFYGVDLGGVFCGESMFSKQSNASKFAFIHFVRKFKEEGGKLIDCQVHTNHLASLGAVEIPRTQFKEHLYSYSSSTQNLI